MLSTLTFVHVTVSLREWVQAFHTLRKIIKELHEFNLDLMVGVKKGV